MLSALKKLFFWNYERNTWQWDLLCVAILIFIFLTPNRWFNSSERSGIFQHQSPASSILVIVPELIENAQDKGQVERLVQEFTGRKDIQVLAVRKVVGKDGKTQGYEVDIR